MTTALGGSGGPTLPRVKRHQRPLALKQEKWDIGPHQPVNSCSLTILHPIVNVFSFLRPDPINQNPPLACYMHR